MPARTVLLIIFLEGLASLGAEVIALRRLLPHVGSSILVTAPTIALFLLALALGYHAGGKLVHRVRQRLATNFILSAALIGLGMSRQGSDALFQLAGPDLGWGLFVAGLLGPVAYWLGQTVPALTQWMVETRVEERSGNALFWSTLGSVLGALIFSLGLMNWWSVSGAVWSCTMVLLAGAFLLRPPSAGRRERLGPLLLLITVGGMSTWLLVGHKPFESPYADYDVRSFSSSLEGEGHAFFVNGSPASIHFNKAGSQAAGDAADSGQQAEPPTDNPTPARYVRHVRQILIDDLGLENESILVLGAGGFSLSEFEQKNRYTYVDIDPGIQKIAEEHFLKHPARGRFIAADARQFVRHSLPQWKVVFVDVFSSQMAIPRHLLVREFWREVNGALNPDGIVIINLILDSGLKSDYARHLLATIESVWGICSREVLFKSRPLSNVIVTCRAAETTRQMSTSAGGKIYTDEHNPSDLEAMEALNPTVPIKTSAPPSAQ